MTLQTYQIVAGDWIGLERIINDLTGRVVGQNMGPSSSPTLAGLKLTGFSGVLQATAGVLSGDADHNSLGNIQGGTTDEYYHLTSAEHTALGGFVSEESDPVFTAWLGTVTPANWNTAYGWGNHAGLYLPIGGGTYPDVEISAGAGLEGVGGLLELRGGDGYTTGGALRLFGGTGLTGLGGDVEITSGSGGNVIITAENSGITLSSAVLTFSGPLFYLNVAEGGISIEFNVPDYNYGDIHLAAGLTGSAIRMFASYELTASPAGGAFQMFQITNPSYPGCVFFDTGAHDDAAFIFRSCGTGGTITERMRITATGKIGINNSAPGEVLDVTGYINASSGFKCGGTAAVADGTYTVGARLTPVTGTDGTITVKGGIITAITAAT